jgi:hypothetical protein
MSNHLTRSLQLTNYKQGTTIKLYLLNSFPIFLTLGRCVLFMAHNSLSMGPLYD